MFMKEPVEVLMLNFSWSVLRTWAMAVPTGVIVPPVSAVPMVSTIRPSASSGEISSGCDAQPPQARHRAVRHARTALLRKSPKRPPSLSMEFMLLSLLYHRCGRFYNLKIQWDRGAYQIRAPVPL